MGRLLVLIVLAYLVSLWLGSAVKRLRSPAPPVLTPKETATEQLARCALCGVYVPRSRALAGGPEQDVYCSETCRQKAS
ncbi:MAG TPA: PP0621 family protein [Thermoanaerobaculia bacterium]|nr:PP0621 family protein [Thermoanaerobaculia bacterium]